ncbi:MAG TPA: DUF1990 domain-containing protein [Planctomycetota bacterium]
MGRPLVLLRAPDEALVRAFHAAARDDDFSYLERHASRERAGFPPGYDHDHTRVRLGSGGAVFAAARRALERWEMFPPAWSRVHPRTAPGEGDTVCVLFHLLGLHWLNAARIVYRLEEQGSAREAGFAYGTLGAHVERGEECFRVTWEADDSVWYDLRAFSRPAFWPVRLARPVARALQRRFQRESQAAMRAAVRTVADSATPPVAE